MARRLALSGFLFVLAASAIGSLGCSGSDGAAGPAGPAGATGPAGDPGSQGATGPEGPAATANPSVSGVTPGKAFLDRDVDVTISGFGTAWTNAATVDFGANVTVNSVVAASPTALLANITVGADATLGARDVIITEGDSTLTYSGAFKLESPLNLIASGSVAQGSVVILKANGLDFTTPFDTTYTGDGFFTPIEYTNIAVSAIPGLTASISSVQPYSIDMLMFVDVDTTAGSKDFDVLSGPAGSQTHFPYPGAMNVVARAATPVTAGTAATGTIANAYDSALYSFTPGDGDRLVTLEVTSDDASAVPGIIILPASGKFADLLDYTNATQLITSASDPYYLVVWENAGAAGFDFEINASQLALTSLAEAESNNTAALAQVATTFPFLFKNASLPALTDEDWIKITATANDVGKTIHVITIPGDAQCDTVVDVFESDGTTSLGGPSGNADFHENFTSDPIPAAGVYYVKISADQTGWYDPAYPKYQALITIE